jgi:hypothetical protein
MIAMSILAMAMVICLFGGYAETPNEHQELIHKQVGEGK